LRAGSELQTLQLGRKSGRIGEDAFDVDPKNGRPVVLIERAFEYWYKYNPGPGSEVITDNPEENLNAEDEIINTVENHVDKTEKQKAKEDRDQRAKEYNENRAKNELAADQFADAELREKIAKANLAEIKLKEATGELVPIAEVKKNLFTYGVEIKNALLSIPDRIIDNLLASDSRSEAHTLLTVAINKALVSLTDIENRKFIKDK